MKVGFHKFLNFILNTTKLSRRVIFESYENIKFLCKIVISVKIGCKHDLNFVLKYCIIKYLYFYLLSKMGGGLGSGRR